MNLKETLRHIADKSTALWEIARFEVCESAKNYNAVVLTENHDTAQYLKKRYGVDAKSIEMNLEGFEGPFFLDPYAVSSILKKAANKIESLEADAALLELKVKRLESL